MGRLSALIEAPDHVCWRYRLRAFAPALARAGWTLEPTALNGGAGSRAAALWRSGSADAVILQRKLLGRLPFGLLRNRARRLVFDFDDAVLYRDSYDPRGVSCPRRRARFRRTMREADLILAGNGFLGDCARDCGARPDAVRLMPTCIETHRYPADRRAKSEGPIDLVWIGSSSTLQGLEQRRPLLERIGRTVPGVRLRVICDRFPRFDHLPVLAVPWSEAGEVAAIAAGDVGISLVPDDLWSRGKCGLKLLQFMATGLPVVADPVGVHPVMVSPGDEGYLPATDDAWVEAIATLASDPALRDRMGRAARRRVDAEFSVTAWEERFVQAVTGGESARERTAA